MHAGFIKMANRQKLITSQHSIIVGLSRLNNIAGQSMYLRNYQQKLNILLYSSTRFILSA